MNILQNTKRFIAVAIVSSIIVACSGDSQEVEKQEEHVAVEINMENLTTVNYAIEGMVCAMGCAATIQEEVAGLSGVAEADVDYAAEKASFKFDGDIVTEEEIIAKIESIADGQYKVNEWVEQEVETADEEVEAEEGNSADESSKIEVSLPSFEIPNLFTLILDQV